MTAPPTPAPALGTPGSVLAIRDALDAHRARALDLRLKAEQARAQLRPTVLGRIMNPAAREAREREARAAIAESEAADRELEALQARLEEARRAQQKAQQQARLPTMRAASPPLAVATRDLIRATREQLRALEAFFDALPPDPGGP